LAPWREYVNLVKLVTDDGVASSFSVGGGVVVGPTMRRVKTMANELLEHDHELLAQLLHELESGLREHNARQSFELLDLFWARLAMHIRAEHLWLFPAILNAPRNSFSKGGVPSFEEVALVIEGLRSDHNFFMDELAKAVKTFRLILAANGGSQDVGNQLDSIRMRVDAVSRRLQSHNELEEQYVYEWPGLLLDSVDLEVLVANLKRELDNLPQRFQAKRNGE